MGKAFKRSLWGYHTAMVDETINKSDHEYKNQLLQLKNKLSQEVEKNELLMEQIKKVKKEVERYHAQEIEISNQLLKSFLEASETVYRATLASDQKEKEASDQVTVKKTELVNLQTGADKLKEDIHAVINQYLALRDKAEGE